MIQSVKTLNFSLSAYNVLLLLLLLSYRCYGNLFAVKMSTTCLTIEHLCEALEPKIKGVFIRLYRCYRNPFVP